MFKNKVSHSQIGCFGAVEYTSAMSLNLRIRQLRESRGWSLDTLAAKVGISAPHLSQVERGIKNLNNRLITDLSYHLGVEPFELFVARQKTDDLVNFLAVLPDDDRARVRAFAEALAGTRKPEGE